MAVTPMSRPRWTVVGVIIAVLLAARCTSSTSPGEAVPELRRSLMKVDQAIVEQRYERARTRLHELVHVTTAAREDGTLDASDTEPILAAAASLLSALPEHVDRSNDSSPIPDADDAGDASGEQDRGHERDEEEKKQEEEEKKQEGSPNGNGGGGGEGD